MTTVSPLGQGLLLPDGSVNTIVMLNLLNDLRNGMVTLWLSGTTGQRPNDPYLGQIYYDTTLGAFVYCSAVRVGSTPAVWTPITGMSSASKSLEYIGAQTTTFTWPANVDLVWVTLLGAGSGGARPNNALTIGGGAGAAGEFWYQWPIYRNGNLTSTLVLAAGGLGATTNNTNSVAASDSTFTTGAQVLTAKGGKAAVALGTGAAGGGGLGAPATVSGPGLAGTAGAAGGNQGGAAGGAGGTAASGTAGGPSSGGGPATGGTAGGGNGGGGGGASSPKGAGGNGGNGAAGAGSAGANATGNGAGGGGGGDGTTSSNNGGNGSDAYAMIEWIG